MKTDGTQAGDRLAGFDFAAHHAEQSQAWAAFQAGRPTRVPIILGTNSRDNLEALYRAGRDFGKLT